MNGVATQVDILTIEAKDLPADLPGSTYEMIQRSAAINPQARALSFFLQTNDPIHAVVKSANDEVNAKLVLGQFSFPFVIVCNRV